MGSLKQKDAISQGVIGIGILKRFFTFVYPLTARVVGAPQMTSQPASPICFPALHCPLGLSELQTCPFTDIVFPPLFSVCHVFFPLSLCVAVWFWPDLMNGRQSILLQFVSLRVVDCLLDLATDFLVGNVVFV